MYRKHVKTSLTVSKTDIVPTRNLATAGHQHGEEHTDRFWTISRYGLYFIGAIILWKVILFPEHAARPEGDYKYMRRRVKPFPWGDGDHNLFGNPERLQHGHGHEEHGENHH